MAQHTQSTLIRRCTKCQEWRTLDRFYADTRNSSGYRADCKDCHKAQVRQRQADPRNHAAYLEYQAAYRTRHRAKARAVTAAYRAANPGRVQAAQAAYLARPENQETARRRAREFRIANPDRRAEYERRRRAFKRASVIGFITPAMLEAKFAYWGNRCWMCESPDDLQVEHVKPLSKGGAHILANLRPACGTCNRTKSARWPLRR